MSKNYATVTLKFFKAGIYAECEDLELTEFISKGDGQAMMDFLNEVDEFSDPDTTYVITEKGKEYLNSLIKEENNEKDL